jgi:hypothetical protein
VKSILPRLLLVACCTATEASAKSLIEMGWDEPDPAFMRQHLAEIEAQPFDGLVYHVGGDRGGDAKGLTGAFTWKAWGTRRWTDAELATDLRDLQAIRWTKFRHNFLRVNMTPADLDWFDDYSPVLANLTLAASIARRAGSTGILFDTESYEGQPFSYPKQKGTPKRSFKQYQDQIRLRGAEVMRAFEKGYPGLTLFLTLGATHADIQRRGDNIQFDKGLYGLLPAFVEGLVDGASPSAKIVDGMEGSYPVRTNAEVENYFKQHDLYLPTTKDPAKYRKTVSRGMGLWFDFDWRHRGWNPDKPDSNYRTPAILRQSLRRALELSDEYVWLYGEKPRWWTAKGGREELPEVYVQAVADARKGLAP